MHFGLQDLFAVALAVLMLHSKAAEIVQVAVRLCHTTKALAMALAVLTLHSKAAGIVQVAVPYNTGTGHGISCVDVAL